MPDKSFQYTVAFPQFDTPQGPVWLPLVTVTLIQSNGNRIDLPLMFDTGASVTTLRHDLYFALGVSAWNVGQPVQTQTAGGVSTVYQYDNVNIELLGKAVTCPVQLNEHLPAGLPWMGLLGRATIFEQFGFGFWESARALYVTTNP